MREMAKRLEGFTINGDTITQISLGNEQMRKFGVRGDIEASIFKASSNNINFEYFHEL